MTPGRVVTAAVAVVALVLASTSASAPYTAAPGSGLGDIFRLRPDPRLCPSPLCGGFFMKRVNRATTPCADGTFRAWCYVASLDLSRLSSSARNRLQVAERTGGLLLRGHITQGGGAPEFRSAGRFGATEGWLSATNAELQGITYLVRDAGIRCIRAPCFSLRASVVNTASKRTTVSELDLADVTAPPALAERAQAAVRSSGLLVAGMIRYDSAGDPASGRTLVAAQFFLPAG